MLYSEINTTAPRHKQ